MIIFYVFVMILMYAILLNSYVKEKLYTINVLVKD